MLSDPNHRSCLPADQYFLTLCYYGNSLFKERLFGKAEEILKNAILARKSFMKVKTDVYDSSVNYFSEVELLYTLALCYKQTKQFPEAIATLQIISMKNRSAKVNMLLFNIIEVNASRDQFCFDCFSINFWIDSH